MMIEGANNPTTPARRGEPLRVAAYELAIERVLEATRLRGYGGYA